MFARAGATAVRGYLAEQADADLYWSVGRAVDQFERDDLFAGELEHGPS